jgi:hypothetical protein
LLSLDEEMKLMAYMSMQQPEKASTLNVVPLWVLDSHVSLTLA